MTSNSSFSSERGAILIQTAIAALVLVGFGTFVVDYGVLWAARHQAQNAADAGAMAGAIARAYDDFFDDPAESNGGAAENASQVARANAIWGAATPPGAVVTSFACPDDVVAVDPNRHCVTVEVHRNVEYGNALPTLFAPLLGIASHGTRAKASAQVMVANATNCLRPWAIPDKWTDVAPSNNKFEKYDETTGAELPMPHDEYVAPYPPMGPPTGFTFATRNVTGLGDLGASVPLTYYTAVADPIVPGWLVPLEPPGSTYAESRDGCKGQFAVGDSIPISAAPPIPFDFHNLVNDDIDASWDDVNKMIAGSCAPNCRISKAPFSPRLVAIALFDVDLFQYRRAHGDWSWCPLTNPSCHACAGPCVSIANIAGFFIDDVMGSSGHLTSYPGIVPTDAPMLPATSSFLKAITLVR